MDRQLFVLLALTGILMSCHKQQAKKINAAPTHALSAEVKKYIDSISCAAPSDNGKIASLQKEVAMLREELRKVMREADHRSAQWQKYAEELAQTRTKKRTALQSVYESVRKSESELLYEQIVAKCAK